MFFPYEFNLLLYCIYAMTFDVYKRDTSPYHFTTLLVCCFIFLNKLYQKRLNYITLGRIDLSRTCQSQLHN